MGSVCGLLGMLFGYYVIYSTFFSESPSVTPSKRSLTLHPIIPGITTPLSHLPIILFCILLCQLIHELGHAVAAAVENIPLLSSGLSLSSAFVSLPPLAQRCSPTAQLRIIAAGPFHNLLTFLVLSALPYFPLPSTNISHLGALVLNVDSHSVLRPYLPTGTIITHLDDFPLFRTSQQDADPWSSYLLAPQPPLPPLSPFDSPPDSQAQQGWCFPSPAFLNAPSTCCHPPHSPSNSPQSPNPTSHLACFDSLPSLPPPSPSDNTTSHGSSHCIDPIPLLTQPPHPPYPHLSPSSLSPLPPHPYYQRCSSARDCHPTPQNNDNDNSLVSAVSIDYEEHGEDGRQVCIHPRPSELLLRITILTPSPSPSSPSPSTRPGDRDTMQLQTLLWTGPRREIYDQVHTTQTLPFPLSLSNKWTSILHIYALFAPFTRLIYTYTSLASLSLYTLNLLPLPHLDGSHFLSTFLGIGLSLCFGVRGHGHGGEGGFGGGGTLPLYRGNANTYPNANTNDIEMRTDYAEDDYGEDSEDEDHPEDPYSSSSSDDEYQDHPPEEHHRQQHQHQHQQHHPTPFAFTFSFPHIPHIPHNPHNPHNPPHTGHTFDNMDVDIEMGLPPLPPLPSLPSSRSNTLIPNSRIRTRIRRCLRPPRILLRVIYPLKLLLPLFSTLLPSHSPLRLPLRFTSTPTPPSHQPHQVAVVEKAERLTTHISNLTLFLLLSSLLFNAWTSYTS